MMIECLKIFVVGNSRSGTSMMAAILNNHAKIFSFHELHFFEELWDPSKQSHLLSEEQSCELAARLLTIQRDGYFNQRPIDIYLLEARKILDFVTTSYTPPAIFEAFLQYETKQYDKVIACDQTPRNVFYIQEILDLYPDAYLINMIRDPRDIILSQKKKWRRRYLGMSEIPFREMVRARSNYHPITISLLWNGAIRAGDQFLGHPRLIQVSFERFVKDPETSMKELCKFLGIPYQSDMLLVPQIGSSHTMDSPNKKGINPNVADRWKSDIEKDTEDLYICQKITAKYMTLHDYYMVNLNPNWLLVFWILILWPLKSIVALLLNANRTRSLFSTLKKRLLN